MDDGKNQPTSLSNFRYSSRVILIVFIFILIMDTGISEYFGIITGRRAPGHCRII